VVQLGQIIEGEIRKSGTFKEKLTNYAFGFSKSEGFDVHRTENMIREVYQARTGQTFNAFRVSLETRENALTGFDPASGETKKDHEIRLSPDSLEHTNQGCQRIVKRMESGDKMTFHRAYAEQAHRLATQFDITESGAKRLMNHVYRETEGRELVDHGKELEATYYRPQIEAEKAARLSAKQQGSEAKRNITQHSRS